MIIRILNPCLSVHYKSAATLQVVAGGGENHDLAQDADKGDLEVGALGTAEQDLVLAEGIVDDTRVVDTRTLHAQKDLHVRAWVHDTQVHCEGRLAGGREEGFLLGTY
jgi:hypothetical protein